MNSLVVKGFKIGTKNFASLQVGVFKADKIGRIGGQFPTLALCTLHEPYMIPGLVPTGFKDFLVFSVILLDSTNFLRTLFENLINVFFLINSKI